MPFVYPDNNLDFCSNFLSMMWKVAEPHYEPDPVLARALDVLFILHADHEQNAGTTTMRVVGSSHSDPYICTSAAAAALYGPRHGGANEQVIHMLNKIGSIDNVDGYIADVKAGKVKLQGFGHRVYKNFDPRATIIKRTAYEVFEVTGKNPLLDIALKLEEVALADDYFVSRKLYPNVDFYSGLIYQSMGFPIDMFTVLFAIPRTSGWLAHWQELLEQDVRIARPRQLYDGHRRPRLRRPRRPLTIRFRRTGPVGQAGSMTDPARVTITQIDAFTDRPFSGNPAGVVVLDEPAEPAWMQAVALEMNLSETAFLVAVDGGWNLRLVHAHRRDRPVRSRHAGIGLPPVHRPRGGRRRVAVRHPQRLAHRHAPGRRMDRARLPRGHHHRHPPGQRPRRAVGRP